jgi:O-antigen/teichoic acid export membrane protein
MIQLFKTKSEFRNNVIILLSGTAIAQVIPILISPILTRIYSPKMFGQYATFITIVTILSVISSLRYDLAIVRSVGRIQILSACLISIYVNLFSFFLCLFIVLYTTDQLATLLNLQEVKILYLVPFFVLLNGIHQTGISLLNKLKQYRVISKNLILQSTSNSSLNILISALHVSYLGLIFSILISRVISTIAIIRKFVDSVKHLKKSNKFIRFPIKLVAKKNIDLPTYSSLEVLVGELNNRIIYLYFTVFFSLQITGAYFLVNRVLSVPISVLATSFSKVFFQNYVETKNKKKKLVSIWIKIGLYTAPIFLFPFFYIGNLFEFFFGNNWVVAGDIAEVLIPFYYFSLVFGATNTSHVALNLQNYSFFISVISLVSKVIVFYSFHDGQNQLLLILKWLVVIDILAMIIMNFIAFKKAEIKSVN